MLWMDGRCTDRNFVSGDRRGTGAVCRDLAEGSDDMPGMYRDRIEEQEYLEDSFGSDHAICA